MGTHDQLACAACLSPACAAGTLMCEESRTASFRILRQPEAGAVTEYGMPRENGDVTLMRAGRIAHQAGEGVTVLRRKIIVVEDWAEVTAP